MQRKVHLREDYIVQIYSTSWDPLRCKYTNWEEGKLKGLLALYLTTLKFDGILTLYFLENQSKSEWRCSECKIEHDAGPQDKKTIKGATMMKGGSRWAPQCQIGLTSACKRTYMLLAKFSPTMIPYKNNTVFSIPTIHKSTTRVIKAPRKNIYNKCANCQSPV